MADIEEYKTRIDRLCEEKGWNTDWRWLVTGFFAESGELVQGIVKGDAPEQIAEEFADVMHYLLKLMSVKAAGQDLDSALSAKIESNRANRKKTTDSDGNVVLK